MQAVSRTSRRRHLSCLLLLGSRSCLRISNTLERRYRRSFETRPLGAEGGKRVQSLRDAEQPGGNPLDHPAMIDSTGSLMERTGGDWSKAAQDLTRDLMRAGFSCNPRTKAFNCIRLGCKKRLLGRGSLLQWQVGVKPDRERGVTYAPSFIDYGWLLKCVPDKDLKMAEQRFLRGEPVE